METFPQHISAHEENTVAETPDKKEVSEEMENEKELEFLIANAAEVFLKDPEFKILSQRKSVDYEKSRQENGKFSEMPASSLYSLLRENHFSPEEIDELAEYTQKPHHLKEFLKRKIAAESEELATLLRETGLEAKMNRNQEAADTFFKQNGLPNIPHSPRIIVGKYGMLSVYSTRINKAGIDLNGEGEYLPFEKKIVLYQNKETLEANREWIPSLELHESLHARSFSKIEGVTRPFDTTSHSSLRLGFVESKNGNSRKRGSGLKMNEGFTEYLTKVISGMSGEKFTVSPAYEAYMNDMEATIEYMRASGCENATSLLLKAYTESDGIEQIKALFEKYIGPYSYELFSVKNYADFLSALKKYKETKLPETPALVKINTSEIPANISPKEILSEYPFIEFGELGLNEETEVVEWQKTL